MSVTPPDPAIRTALREQAADWHIRLASDVASEQDWLDFEAWISVSDDHLHAYEAVEALWSDLQEVAPRTEAANVVPLLARRTRRRVPAWVPAMAAAGVVLTVGVGFVLRQVTPPAAIYETPRGERQTVRLADGSQLTLNGGTRVTVRFRRSERDLELARGEAVFDVARDASRPFVVALGDRQVRVVGTQFNILRQDGAIVVTVRRGVVEVRPASSDGAGVIARLEAGRRLSHREGVPTDQVGPGDPEAAFAWTEGRLIFRNERLADVVNVLNRYVDKPVLVEAGAQDIRVTAVVPLDKENAMLSELSSFLPIEVRRGPGEIRLAPR